MENNINKIDKLYSFEETVIKQIIKQDNEETKKAIIRYVQANYPNKNIRIDFLDEEKVKRIIDLGIQEYQKKENEEYKIKVLGQFDVEKNIDKDIKILEEFKEKGYATLMIKYGKNRIQTNTMIERAISNVLSEFETLREISGELVIDNANLKIEAETYKKIAEKLADKMIYLPINKDGIFYCTKEAIIDWARKEVEKNGNK